MFVDTNFPGFQKETDTEEKLRTMQDYLYMLVEQLRYSLYNLDTGNMNQAALAAFEKALTEPIYVRIENGEGAVAALKLTADGLLSRVEDAEDRITEISQTAGNITLSAVNDGESSILQLMAGETVLSSAVIVFDGMVTFTDLGTAGSTVIDAGNIVTGTINADQVGVNDKFALYRDGMLYGYMGCGYGSDGEWLTYGAILSGPSEDTYVIVTDMGVRLTAGGCHLMVLPGSIQASEEIAVTSDRDEKTGISYDMERYEDFFRRLRPCRFRMKNGTGGRFHTGYIAQDVERALLDSGLSGTDFAALVRDETGYRLRYGEFTALHTHMVQKLMDRVDALEQRIKELEEKE